MTRTERSSFPRAMIKDRSESRSGLDKSIRKNGAGQHNWGSLVQERYLESAALEDELYDEDDDYEDDDNVTSSESAHSDQLEQKKPTMVRSASLMSEEEIETAKQFRKHAFKGEGIDLATIARTSAAASTSPPKTAPIVVATFEDSPV